MCAWRKGGDEFCGWPRIVLVGRTFVGRHASAWCARQREGRGKEKGPRKSAPKRAVERLQTAQVHQSHSIDDKLCYRLDDLSESERNVERTEGEDGEE